MTTSVTRPKTLQVLNNPTTYTCANRHAGTTYVALLIVLLPDGGYTLANIVNITC